MSGHLAVEDLTVRFAVGSPVASRLRGRPPERLTAVDGISFAVPAGESFGIVGESGCGKSTLARCLVGLQVPTSGRIRLDGQLLSRRRSRDQRRLVQMVFQNPGSSLNPALTIGGMLTELLHVHGLAQDRRPGERVAELLDLVELPRRVADLHPGSLSGGQRQRAGIARALALEPSVLIADEAVAALDTSVQASVLNLFADLRDQLGLTLIFISHDLAVVRYLAERVMVMYLGAIAEDRPAEALFTDPQHPYTRALLAAAPRLDQRNMSPPLGGEPPSPISVPPGCRFHTRCPVAIDRCRTETPDLTGPAPDQRAACHLAWEVPLVRS
jgi:oligopeptide/dipeptide ABC transporter ATP-binding protein